MRTEERDGFEREKKSDGRQTSEGKRRAVRDYWTLRAPRRSPLSAPLLPPPKYPLPIIALSEPRKI
eukprot:scaffold8904_cov149-Skeletonema_menzelii.AAC.9